jgi:hypothetical protein
MYSSPNIIRAIELRKMRLVGHVACMGDRKIAYLYIWWGDLRRRDYFEEL